MNLSSSSSGIPRLQFSSKRRKELETIGDNLLEHALRVHEEFHASEKQAKLTKQWKLSRRKKSLSIYRERGKSKSKEERLLLCSGIVPGTVEDLVTGFNDDDTECMRISHSILTSLFMDGSVVHVFERNPVTSSVVFSGIKWMAMKSPTSASLIHDRDALGYHRIGRIVDRRGQYFVYYVIHSIDLPEIPANQQRNLERANVDLCYLFRQVQEEWVGCFILGNASMGGSMPRSMGEMMASERMLTVGNFLRVAHAKAYSALMAKSADQLSSTSDCCDVCMKKPNMLDSSLKLCMGCRRKACKKCRECCTVFRLAPRTHRPEKEIFCSQCISEVTKPTTSTFYTSSLNESMNQVHNEGSASMSSSTKQSRNSGVIGSSSHSSSPHSHEFSAVEMDPWLMDPPELPENLDGLADFVERASLANSRGQQWNQQELDYLSEMLRESGRNVHGHGNHTYRTQSSREFHPGGSLPPPDCREKLDRRMSRSFADFEDDERTKQHDKHFSVDELD